MALASLSRGTCCGKIIAWYTALAPFETPSKMNIANIATRIPENATITEKKEVAYLRPLSLNSVLLVDYLM